MKLINAGAPTSRKSRGSFGADEERYAKRGKGVKEKQSLAHYPADFR